jgi:hypothetical protein
MPQRGRREGPRRRVPWHGHPAHDVPRATCPPYLRYSRRRGRPPGRRRAEAGGCHVESWAASPLRRILPSHNGGVTAIRFSRVWLRLSGTEVRLCLLVGLTGSRVINCGDEVTAASGLPFDRGDSSVVGLIAGLAVVPLASCRLCGGHLAPYRGRDALGTAAETAAVHFAKPSTHM